MVPLEQIATKSGKDPMGSRHNGHAKPLVGMKAAVSVARTIKCLEVRSSCQKLRWSTVGWCEVQKGGEKLWLCAGWRITDAAEAIGVR